MKRHERGLVLAALLLAPALGRADDDAPTPLNAALQPGAFLSFDGADTRASVSWQQHAGLFRVGVSASAPLDAETRFGVFAGEPANGRTRLASGVRGQLNVGLDFDYQALSLPDDGAQDPAALQQQCDEVGADPCTPENLRQRRLQRRCEDVGVPAASCTRDELRRRRSFLDLNGLPDRGPGRSVRFTYVGVEFDTRYTRVSAIRDPTSAAGSEEDFDSYRLRLSGRVHLSVSDRLTLVLRGGVSWERDVATRTVRLCQTVTAPTDMTASACRDVQQLKRPVPNALPVGSVQLSGLYLFGSGTGTTVPGVEFAAALDTLGEPGTTLTLSPGFFMSVPTGAVLTRYGVAVDIRNILRDDSDNELVAGEWYVAPRLVVGASF